MTSVLVTGGSGYIGSMVVRHLHEVGHDVTSLDCGRQGGCPSDIMKPYCLLLNDDALDRFDWVVHLAAHSSVGMCRHDPIESYSNNVTNFLGLLRACRHKNIIYASSVSVYGSTGSFEAVEGDRLPQPTNHYDAHKQDIDRYASLYDTKAWGLRFGTVCGWSPNLREDLLLNSMAMSAVRKGKVRLANPKARRPILGLGDLCRAISHVVAGSVSPGLYNLVTKNVTMEEVAEAVAGICRAGIEVVQMDNSYDIFASSAKFSSQGGFKFTDWIPDLILGVCHGWEKCERIGRRDS